VTTVAVIGHGAIGRRVVDLLHAGTVPGAEPVGVVNDRPVIDCPLPRVSLAEALDRAEVIVECAGQSVVSRHGVEILDQGRDLLITSSGALADPELVEALASAGPGRLTITSGAIGGIDLLVSARAYGAIHAARVTTSKLPLALLQPWMDEDTQLRVSATTEPIEVFRGNAAEAARYFPRSLNVAATVGLAVGDMECVEVRLVADPGAELTRHLIEVEAAAGDYRFEIRNRPSPDNPRTSGVVAHAVLRSLALLVGRPAGIM